MTATTQSKPWTPARRAIEEALSELNETGADHLHEQRVAAIGEFVIEGPFGESIVIDPADGSPFRPFDRPGTVVELIRKILAFHKPLADRIRWTTRPV